MQFTLFLITSIGWVRQVFLHALPILTFCIVSHDCARAVVSVPLPVVIPDARRAVPLAHEPSSVRALGAAVLAANRFGDDSLAVLHPAVVALALAAMCARCG